MKSNKQIIVDAIIAELKKGTASEKISRLITTKHDIHRATFYNYLKKAEQQHREAQGRINIKLTELDTEKALEARRRNLSTSLDRHEFLDAIFKANTTLQKIGNNFIEGTFEKDHEGKIMKLISIISLDDKMTAIKEINKMDGSYAPEKIDQNNTGKLIIEILRDAE